MKRSPFYSSFLPTLLLLISAEVALAQNWSLTGAPLTNWTSLAASGDGDRLVAAAFGATAWDARPGAVLISSNAGVSWTAVTPSYYGIEQFPGIGWRSVACSADGTKLFAVGGIQGDVIAPTPVFVSTNAGSTWTNTDTFVEFWTSLAVSADGSRVAAFSSDPWKLYVSRDSGQTWTQTSVTNVSRGAWSADGKTLVVAGGILWGASTLATSTNAGTTWTKAGLTNVSWSSVAASADGAALAAASSPGRIFLSQDAGATWVETSAPSNYWSDIACSADGTKLVAATGRYGVNAGMPIYTSADSGATWASNSVPDGGWISVASSADGCKLWAAESNHAFGSFNPSGIYGWQTIPTPVLSVVQSGTDVFVSWTVPSMSFVLQQTASVAEAAWTNVGVEPALNATNLRHEVKLQLEGSQMFYRLTSR